MISRLLLPSAVRLERCAVILDHCTFYPLVRDVSDTPNLTEQCLTGAIAGVVQFH
jgi:hypothetical protein